MSRKMWQWRTIRTLLAFVAVIVLASSAIGCSDGSAGGATGGKSDRIEPPKPQIVEVSPPTTLQDLRRDLDLYRPQVSIISPEPDTVLEEETVTIQLQVEDLPTFKDARFGLGPHLKVILDNQPEISVYNPSEPLVLEELSPGTHTLRVFASRPWHESFKNDGAYAQTTFHIYARSDENQPDPALPLLTYSRPKGIYGAEPIMLDYYLTNAPLHLVAQESTEDEIVDWQIRWTIDGKSFTSDRWQPIYLQGFAPGKHWVQLEFLDELGNRVKNTFNNTVRTIVYEPGGEDTLSRLVRGELSAIEVRGIVDPNNVYEEESTLEEELVPEEAEPLIDETAEPAIDILEEESPETEPTQVEEPVIDIIEEESLETETLIDEIAEPVIDILEEESPETEPTQVEEPVIDILEDESPETEPTQVEEPAIEILEEESLESETLIDEIAEPVIDILEEESPETEPTQVEEPAIDEILEEESPETETLTDEIAEPANEILESETLIDEIAKPANEILEEESPETEPTQVEEPAIDEILETETLETDPLPEEELNLVNDIEEIEPIGEEQMENLDTIEIELPDLGLYPTIPRGLDVPESLELEAKPDTIEPNAAQLEAGMVEEMPAVEGNPETIETPVEEIELL